MGRCPGLGPGKGARWPPGLERKAGAGLAVGGWLLLTHRHSAVFPHRESISQTASRPHSQGPGCPQRHRGGQWRAFCIWWAADFHGRARVLMPHLVGMKDQSRCTPSPEHNPQLGGETPLHPRTVSSPEWAHRSLLEDEGMGKCRDECARYRGHRGGSRRLWG